MGRGKDPSIVGDIRHPLARARDIQRDGRAVPVRVQHEPGNPSRQHPRVLAQRGGVVLRDRQTRRDKPHRPVDQPAGRGRVRRPVRGAGADRGLRRPSPRGDQPGGRRLTQDGIECGCGHPSAAMASMATRKNLATANHSPPTRPATRGRSQERIDPPFHWFAPPGHGRAGDQRRELHDSRAVLRFGPRPVTSRRPRPAGLRHLRRPRAHPGAGRWRRAAPRGARDPGTDPARDDRHLTRSSGSLNQPSPATWTVKFGCGHFGTV